jgi:YD repeat-containing protein
VPGVIVARQDNNADQRATMVLPGSRTATYAYNAAGQLASITDWQSRAIGFTYNADGQRTGITRPNGVSSTYAYDIKGRLTSVVHAGQGGTIQSFAYTLDAAGNRTSVTSLAGTENYTLDALDRLTNVTYPNGDIVSYTYDPNGSDGAAALRTARCGSTGGL